MKRLPRFIFFVNFINTFSIWVALGSFITFYFFSLSLGPTPNVVAGVILSLSIWVIYTLDHLLDSFSIQGLNTSLRHTEHSKYSRLLMTVCCIISIVIVYLVFYRLEKKFFNHGWTLLGLTIIHFLFNFMAPSTLKKRFIFKEIGIAFIVTAGFSALPLAGLNNTNLPLNYIHIQTAFFLINLANLLLFSYFDFDADSSNNFTSAAVLFGKKKVLNVAKFCVTLAAIILLILIYTSSHTIVLITLLGMNAVLACICWFSNRFVSNDLYRFWGDFIYLLPLLALPFL